MLSSDWERGPNYPPPTTAVPPFWPFRISRSRIRFKRFPCHPWPYDWFSQSSWQVVTPATTTVTPLPWGSRPVGNPVFRHHETYERHVGASHITLMRPHWSPSFPQGYPE